MDTVIETLWRDEQKAMGKTGSAFRDWFEEQAGKPPISDAEYIKLRSETIPSLRFKLAQAENKLSEMDRYAVARQYALYAWTSK